MLFRSTVVSFVRVICRKDGAAGRMDGMVLYGSVKSGAEETDTEERSVALTDGFVHNEQPGEGDSKIYGWTEKEVPVFGVYRSYYFAKSVDFNANIAEIEFYGWTLDDVDNPPLDFTVERTDLAEYRPAISWNAIGEEVQLQRADNANGPWGTLATFAASDDTYYVDTTVKRYGLKYFYRLKYGNKTSEVQSFRRLRKLSTGGKTIFTNAITQYGAKELAFDGNTETMAEYSHDDIGYVDPKIGVDFDSDDIAVAMVRFYPRHPGNGHHSANAVLYGSNRSAADESSDFDLAQALTAKTTFVDGMIEWQEREVEFPDYYRTYYYQGNYNGAMCEVELYGWFLSDIVRPFKVYIR